MLDNVVEEWKIDESNLEGYHLPFGELSAVMSRFGITVEGVGEGELLWDGSHFHLYQASKQEGHHPDHLVILPKSGNISEEIAATSQFLRKDLGYPATFIFSSGKRFEIIPRGDPELGPNHVHLKEKLAALGYAIDRQFKTSIANRYVSPNSKEKIKLIGKRFSSSSHVEESEPFTPFLRKVIGVQSAVKAVVQHLFRQLSANKCLVEGGLPIHPILGWVPDEIESKVNRCVFCDSQIIENQMIFEGKYSQVICNHKPWGYNHMMIVTKKHHQLFEMLSEEERLEVMEFSDLIHQILSCENPDREVVHIIQNGVAAGQTVPHFHMHVLSKPEKLNFIWVIVRNLLGMDHKLTLKQMQVIREKYSVQFVSNRLK